MSRGASDRFHSTCMKPYPMRRFVYLSLALFAILPACTPDDHLEERPLEASAEEPAGARAAVEALLADQEQAIRGADMAALDTLWADGAGVHIFEQGGVDSSWAAYRDHHLGPELAALEELDFRHQDVHVRVGSRLATATGHYELHARHGDEPIESRGVFTTVLERRNGAWKIAHTHLSRRPRR